MLILILLLNVISSLFSFTTTSESYCYVQDENPYLRFSTRTLYDVVRGSDSNHPPKCKPVYMWALIRHGIRYTSSVHPKHLYNLRNLILKNHKQQRGTLCSEDLENLKIWKYSGEGKAKDNLTPFGYYSVAELGRRIRNNFQELLSDENIEVFSTLKNRTYQTAKTFLSSFDEPLKPIIRNNSLRFLELDRKWLEEAFYDTENQKEGQLFEQSLTVKRLRREISDRLGFNRTLLYGSILDMYKMCSFDQVWYPQTKTAFCGVFLEKHLKILEFNDDLQYYYRLGYGTPYNIYAPNPMFEDLIFKIINASNDQNQYRASFYFSHSTILLQMLVKLNLYKDNEPLTHNSFNESNEHQWSTSSMAPFTANLIAILYKCNGTNQIILYHNEHIIKFPQCNEDGLCPLEFYLDKYQTYLKSVFRQNSTAFARGVSQQKYSTFKIELLFIPLLFYVTISL